MEGALESKIVAATVRKIAKLSSEVGGSGKFENIGDFHMPLLLLQKVTDMHNKNCVAIVLVLIIVGLTDIPLHMMMPLLFYFFFS